MPEKCLLIGLGNIGMKYDFNLDHQYVLTHARAIITHPEFELVGAVDNEIRNRNEFTIQYSKPAYDNIKEAIDKTKPKIIIIATPTGTHSKVLKIILSITNPKLILCEKFFGIVFNFANNF